MYRDYINNIYFLLLVGLLSFTIQTYPDIQFSVSLIVQFDKNSEIAYLEVIKCILYYLKDTIDFNLILDRCSRVC